MQQAVFENAIWASATAGELALVCVLLIKRRWTAFPAFSTLITLNALTSPVLFYLDHVNATVWYARIYWSHAVINVLLQLGVILQLLLVVLRPTGTWVRDARKQFALWGAIGAAVALGLAWLVAPPTRGIAENVEIRGDLFTSLLTCELVIAVTMASNRLGLGWKNHIMAIGQGLTIWSTIAVITDSLHSYFGELRFFWGAEDIKAAAYLVTLGYWCVQLWHEEPARQPISPELRNYILALHRRVHYDLGEAEQ